MAEGDEQAQRVEHEKERLNRKLIELLNELRIALPGVQVLFAFLLTVPFSSGFARTTELQRNIYAVSLGGAAVASALLIAPAAYHRLRFHRLEEETVADKEELILASDHLAAAGIFVLAIAMTGAIFVAIDVVFSTKIAAPAAAGLGVVFVWFWYALPISRRARRSRPTKA
jgi:uncharacterized protein DUF6328